MKRTARCVALACLAGGLAIGRSANTADRDLTVERFDSGTRVVREVAEALTDEGQSILECYPWGSRMFLGLVALFPPRTRIALIEWGMRLSVGHDAVDAARLDVDSLPRWCVDQYPKGDRLYEAIVVGSPNGAVAHLAALLGAPFLTTSFGLTFRHPTIDAEDHLAYLESSRALVDSILAANEGTGFELIVHYDPLHDRSLVEVVDFVRVKLRELPTCYREFIERHLAPGGRLVIIDCAYAWPQYELRDRVTLQVGGLGGVPPETFLEQWPFELPVSTRRESEWGCPEPFASAAAEFAADRGIESVEISFEHPWDYSLLAHDAYLVCEGVRGRSLVIDCFNHLNPRTNVETGIPALWLPFNTEEGLALVEEALSGEAFDRIRFAILPSFAESPDTAPLGPWIDLLSRYGEVELVGIDPKRFPADPLAPFRFVDRMNELGESERLDRPLRLEVEDLVSLLSDLIDRRNTPRNTGSEA
jgi:hypothetical protein